MPKRFIINVGGTHAVAELLEREAAHLSRCFWDTLPVESFAVHAKFAGQEMIVMVPFYAEPENEILDVGPGDIGYYPGRQTICIFYGATQPFGHVSVFARIVERLDDLRAIGDQLLDVGMLPATLERLPARGRVDSMQDAGVPFAHLRCSAPLEPTFYEQALQEKEYTTARVLGELRAFIQQCWADEPADIAVLRSTSRPPMGHLPCDFYANFNLFWAGENLQVCRQLVKDRAIPVQMACQVVAGLLERHAARLEKWSMFETVALERMLAQYFKGNGPANSEELLAVIEHALIALDRVQSWVDGLLPWNELDRHLMLRRPIAQSER